MDTEAKAWKTIWSAGQGVTSIEDSPSSKDLIDSLKEEFTSSINKQTEMLKKYS
jgi:nitronate monooxygenase